MWKRIGLAAAFGALLAWTLAGQRGSVQAIEISAENANLLPAGKEADGIAGDFVLRNEKIHALISGNLPDRRANMSTEYRFPTPGCLYDLDLIGASNDQLTVFRPGQLGGELSWVRIAKDGSDGEAVVESVRTAAKGNGLYQRHEYHLQSGWQHLVVVSTYRNEANQPQTITPAPAWKEFSKRWKAGDITVGDSIDPFDKRAYAWTGAPEDKITLAPGEEKTYRVTVAVADSPLAAYGLAAAANGATEEVTGTAPNADQAAIAVNVNGAELPAYPDPQGRFRFRLPAGRYTAKFRDLGRDEITKEFSAPGPLDFAPPAAARVRFDIRDQAGQPSACKVQFLGRNGTPDPNFGTEYRAHGNSHQYQSHNGQFTQQAPPGDYLIRITHGPEYDMEEREIRVEPGKETLVTATFKRTVNTAGWISTDYHAHSTPSGDNYCNTTDRIINFAAEQIEFAPTTEHNRIYDWAGTIDRLGLTGQLKTIIGMELTGSGQHFNAFPLRRSPLAQDGGAPKWNNDPRITAITLRDVFDGGPERWVQANHPIVGEVFNDRNRDGVEDGGFIGFERLIDAAETWSTEILNPNPRYEIDYPTNGQRRTYNVENRTFGWLQMLNQGRHVWCVAVSDAHRIYNGGVGDWRTYVPSSTDNPAEIKPEEIIRNSKSGRMMITNGPFLEVTTDDGRPIGSTIIAAAGVTLKIKVQTANWMEIDRVQILVNGRQAPEYNFTRANNPAMFRASGALKFEAAIPVKLQRDAHLIVVATGEQSDLKKGWGRSEPSRMHPLAYTNPIYVDLDGKGFQPNGDTLGHPIITAKR